MASPDYAFTLKLQEQLWMAGMIENSGDRAAQRVQEVSLVYLLLRTRRGRFARGTVTCTCIPCVPQGTGYNKSIRATLGTLGCYMRSV